MTRRAVYGPVLPPGPLLVLDVDGVLSPSSGEVPTAGGWDDWAQSSGSGLLLPLSAAMGGALAVLPATMLLLTDWQGDAQDAVCGPLGWGPVPFLADDARAVARVAAEHGWTPGRWWKADALRAWLCCHGPRQVVWADDDLVRYRAAARAAAGPGAELVVPARHVGLTRRHLARMGRVLEGAASGGPAGR